MNEALFELLFMMVILKIPIVYLCLVVWWAIRAEPRPLEGAVRPVEPRCPWRPLRPRGGPSPRFSRRRVTARVSVRA
jgi:hypothetical protein